MGSGYIVAGEGREEDLAIDLESGGISDEQIELLHAGKNPSRSVGEESKNKKSDIDAKMVAEIHSGKASSVKHPKPPRHPKSFSVGSEREISQLAKSKRWTNKRPRKMNSYAAACGANIGAWIVTLLFFIVIIRQVLS